MKSRKNIIRLLLVMGFLKVLSIRWQQENINKELETIHKQQIEIQQQLQNINNKVNENEEYFGSEINKNKEYIKELKGKVNTTRGTKRELNQTFIATAYTNSKDENGKWGAITKTGVNISNMGIENKIIAVDPKVIPLKSKLYLQFPEDYKHLDGIWTAEDTGNFSGNRIDLFVGSSKKVAFDFGRREIKVKYIINN